AGVLGYEQIVHHTDAAGVAGWPGPEHGGEAGSAAGRISRDELQALVFGVIDERRRKGEQRPVGGRDVVEIAVRAHQREEIAEVLRPDQRDRILRHPRGGLSVLITRSAAKEFSERGGGRVGGDVVSLAGERTELTVRQRLSDGSRRVAQQWRAVLAVQYQCRRRDRGDELGREGEVSDYG